MKTTIHKCLVSFVAVSACCFIAEAEMSTNKSSGRLLSQSERARIKQEFELQNNAFYSITNWDEPKLEAALPQDYQKFKNALARDYGLADASLCIGIMKQAHTLLQDTPLSATNRGDVIEAYRAAWRLCIRVCSGAKNQDVKSAVLKEWDQSLSGPEQNTVCQIYALSEVWDRDFLTDNFWKVFANRVGRPTIAAVAYTLFKHGNQTDASKLTQKRDSNIPVDFKELIQNSLNWMNYRFRGDSNDPGPSAVAPRMEL